MRISKKILGIPLKCYCVGQPAIYTAAAEHRPHFLNLKTHIDDVRTINITFFSVLSIQENSTYKPSWHLYF